MDSIDNGATIRIGLKEYYNINDGLTLDFTMATYSLKINKKSILSSKCGVPNEEYPEVYKKAGKIIADLMKERNVKNYVIIKTTRNSLF